MIALFIACIIAVVQNYFYYSFAVELNADISQDIEDYRNYHRFADVDATNAHHNFNNWGSWRPGIYFGETLLL